jgi:hypothetical protein
MNSSAHIPDVERRHDGPADAVDNGLALAAHEGVGPALDFMLTHGVDRNIALRVLAGPQFHRHREADEYRQASA